MRVRGGRGVWGRNESKRWKGSMGVECEQELEGEYGGGMRVRGGRELWGRNEGKGVEGE